MNTTTTKAEKKFYVQAKNKHNFFILLRENLSIKHAIHYAKMMVTCIDVPVLIKDSETEEVFLTFNSIKKDEKTMGQVENNHL